MRRSVFTSGAIWTCLCLTSLCLLLRVVSTIVERTLQPNTDTTLVINCLLTVALFVQSFLSDSPSQLQSKVGPSLPIYLPALMIYYLDVSEREKNMSQNDSIVCFAFKFYLVFKPDLHWLEEAHCHERCVADQGRRQRSVQLPNL